MEKIVNIDNIKYEIIKNYRDGFNKEEFINKCTEYFYDFDYIVGDWAYDKLRLKGFYDDFNKKSKNFNKISTLDKYLKENCAYECKYFVAKKINV
ncbi:MAG: YutD family protein [Bacilli bacterium]|nr:YutD family protein [Bacilli bacterium]